MPSSDQIIQFKYGLQAKFDGILEKDTNTVYFVTDTQRLFVGDIEYSRPVQHGAALPASYLPPNSFFVKETGTKKELYYSEDGSKWTLIAIGGQLTEGEYGDGTNVAKITVDAAGNISQIEQIPIDFPEAPALEINDEGTGNAVTKITATEHTITVTKGETFATKAESDAIKTTADAAMPKTGGAFTGAVTVQAPTENMNPATKQYVDTAISGITDFDIDANEGSGYATLAALKQAHPTGEKGIFYLVVNPEAGADNAYIEYFWTGTAYEMAGKFGSVDTSNFVTTTELSEGLGLKVDKTTTVNGQPLSGNVTITDITGNAGTADVADKVANKLTINGQQYDGSAAVNVTTPNDNTTYTFANGANGTFSVTPSGGEAQTVSIGKPATAGTADKLTTARAITLTNDATGTVNFDGSANASIAVTVSHAAAADSATNATNATNAENATKATQDADGNVITSTYATKEEVQAASLKWGTF